MPARTSTPSRASASATRRSSSPSSSRTKLASDSRARMPCRASGAISRSPGAADLLAPGGQQLGAAQAGDPGRQRRAVDVERLLDRVQVRRQRLVDEQVAEPQPGQPEDLGERAQHDHRAPGADVGQPVDALRGVDVVAVGLVGDRQAAVRAARRGTPPSPRGARRRPVGLLGSQIQASLALVLGGGGGHRLQVEGQRRPTVVDAVRPRRRRPRRPGRRGRRSGAGSRRRRRGR